MSDELQLIANFKLGDVWSLEAPQDFSVRKEEPLRKSLPADTLGFITGDTLAVIYALRECGVLEWLRKKSYDVLWDYLKSVVLKLPPAILPAMRRATFELKDATGAVRLHADIGSIDVAAFDAACVSIKEELTRANGDTERREIKIDLKRSAATQGSGEAAQQGVAPDGRSPTAPARR
jgi:hypothetical protein